MAMSPDTHATQKVDTAFNITVEFNQADITPESATMVDLNAWVVCGSKQIAHCQGNLIKREMMVDPEMFPYLMEITQELEEVAKDYGIFHPNLDGTMTSKAMAEYLDKLNFFCDDDYKCYHQASRDAKEHPCNRAWILYFNTFTVNEGFRRRHIGRALVCSVLETALRDAKAAGRPLLAGVRPGFLETNNGGEAESVRFWKAVGFERHPSDVQPDLYFWGVAKGLPDDKPIEASAGS